jgi:DNA mismatch endonuclease, patch repair protein
MANSDARDRLHRAIAEQDNAAGGRDNRFMETGGSVFARASIELKKGADNSAFWAYLRWSQGGKTFNRYVGRVYGASRFERLRQGWELARTRGIVGAIANTKIEENIRCG